MILQILAFHQRVTFTPACS